METVRDVNNDIGVWNSLKRRILESIPEGQSRQSMEDLFRAEEKRFSFMEGNKHVIHPVIIAPDEELPVQDTEFVQPKLGETFEMGKEKARKILGRIEMRGDQAGKFHQKVTSPIVF
jgi:predicted patatin/cPLA2 family phospholipase